MSTRTYHLRTRTAAGIANQPRDIPPHLMSSNSVAGPTTTLYSDVVASRPPSPRKETLVSPASRPVTNADDGSERYRSENKTVIVDMRSQQNVDNVTRGDYESPLTGPEEGSWTTVRRRRALSLSSVNMTRRASRLGNTSPRERLTVEQAQVVSAAANNMTEQKKTILRRQKNVAAEQESSLPSRGEGLSKPKGKTIDPNEWGNINISQESLNVEAQRAALDSITKKHRKTKHNDADYTKKSTRKRTSSVQLSKHTARPAESRPAAQIAKGSFLGTALRNVSHHHRASRRGGSPSSPSSSGSSSAGNTSPAGDEGSNVSSASEEASRSSNSHQRHKRRENRHGRNRRRRRVSSRSSSPSTVRSSIKPIPPLEYDGQPDARIFHRFVRESEAYLRDGQVRGRRQVFLLSYYLTGKAYDFYTQKVAINEEKWTLPDFYDELFNYCFPIDYRMQLRRTLARCHQNEKSISEYTHELQELFNMIGDIPERDRVLKFWNGSRPVIQKGLWRDNLNPEISSWAQVVTQAEIIEISENVADRRDHRIGSSSQAIGTVPSSRSEGGPPYGSRFTHNSVRAASESFESKRLTHPKLEVPIQHQIPGPRQQSEHRELIPQARDSPSYFRDRPPPRGRSHIPHSHSPHSQNAAKLSEKERIELFEAGRCFICKETGHFGRDCPSRNTMKSTETRPPGASAFNVEPVVVEEDSDSDEFVEVLDSLPVGAIAINDEGSGLVSSMSLAKFMTHLPCEEVFCEPRVLLMNSHLDLSQWHAPRRARAPGLRVNAEIIHRPYARGSVLGIVATQLLTDGILSSYPRRPLPWKVAQCWLNGRRWEDTTMRCQLDNPAQIEPRRWLTHTPLVDQVFDEPGKTPKEVPELGGVQLGRNKFPSLQYNTTQVNLKGNRRVLPKPIVLKVNVNGQPAQALLDSGALGDFISSALTDKLGLERRMLDSPLSLQLAVQGSRSKVNAATSVRLQFQKIDEEHTFNIANINDYDLILGTPWMYQHQICIRFNPTQVVVGSDVALPLKSGSDTRLMLSSLSPEEERIEEAQGELRRCDDPPCNDVQECPEALCSQCAGKGYAYLRSDRWKITSARNTVLMLLIPKPSTNSLELRTAVDLREHNKTPQKLAYPLPGMDGMLRRTTQRRYRTAFDRDMKSVYGQIRVVPERVEKSTVTTPDANMVSRVVQIGDCDVPGMYHALIVMKYFISSRIGRSATLNIYLDDIAVHSSGLDDLGNERHVRLVLNLSKWERLYLSRSELHQVHPDFVQPVLRLLRRLVDDQGFRMVREEVDSVVNWKISTSRMYTNERFRAKFTYHNVTDNDTSTLLLLLAGIEAWILTRHGERVQWPIEEARIAQTLEPESSSEFTARGRTGFVPRGERKEGGSMSTDTFTDTEFRDFDSEVAEQLFYLTEADSQVRHIRETMTVILKLPAFTVNLDSARSESTEYSSSGFLLRMPQTMIRASAEDSSVQTFALQKKLALMDVHDRILAVRVKQTWTRDANRNQLSIPFKVGNLVYLLTEHISFPKRFARKLRVLKFIVPYKIPKNFGNSSLKHDPPSHMKKRGLHDVPHFSLLCLTVLRDNYQLLPGHMDTQLHDPKHDVGEWAINKILAHAVANTHTIFEVKRKSSDVTWLLCYYQTTHLLAFMEYLESSAIPLISKQPNGSRQPSTGDPQVFLRSIVIILSLPSNPRLASSLQSIIFIFPMYIRLLQHFFLPMAAIFRPFLSQAPFISAATSINVGLYLPVGPQQSVATVPSLYDFIRSTDSTLPATHHYQTAHSPTTYSPLAGSTTSEYFNTLSDTKPVEHGEAYTPQTRFVGTALVVPFVQRQRKHLTDYYPARHIPSNSPRTSEDVPDHPFHSSTTTTSIHQFEVRYHSMRPFSLVRLVWRAGVTISIHILQVTPIFL